MYCWEGCASTVAAKSGKFAKLNSGGFNGVTVHTTDFVKIDGGRSASLNHEWIGMDHDVSVDLTSEDNENLFKGT